MMIQKTKKATAKKNVTKTKGTKPTKPEQTTAERSEVQPTEATPAVDECPRALGASVASVVGRVHGVVLVDQARGRGGQAPVS